MAIHLGSGEYAVADSTGNAMRAMRKSRPRGRLYLTKIRPELEYGLTARILMAEMMAGKCEKSWAVEITRAA